MAELRINLKLLAPKDEVKAAHVRLTTVSPLLQAKPSVWWRVPPYLPKY